MDDLEGPRVFATRENTADSGGGRLELRAGRLTVSGRLRTRDLGPASDLAAVVFIDRKSAELRFSSGAVWIVRAEDGGLLAFSRKLASVLGREGLVQEPPPLAELRTAASLETWRQVAAVVIALSLAAVTVLGTIMLRDRGRQRAREATAHRHAAAMQAARQVQEQAGRTQRSARATALVDELRSAMNAKQWKEAEAHHAALAAIEPDHPMLRPVMTTLRRELDRIAEEERRSALKAGIADARGALVDSVRCDDAQYVSHAWRGLRQARPGDAEWDAATTLARAIERCRLLVAKETARNAAGLRLAQRRRFALELPDRLRREGHAAVVRAAGPAETEITVQIDGIDRESAARAAKAPGPEGGLLAEAEKVGVRKLTFTDGAARFDFPLVPVDDEDAVTPIFETLGLDRPFSLPELPR